MRKQTIDARRIAIITEHNRGAYAQEQAIFFPILV